MRKPIRKLPLTIIVLLVLIMATVAIALATGSASLPLDRILPTLTGNGDFKEKFILLDLRLPRLIITLLAGMALAMSGAVLQGVTRNDLADPGIIGINSGAGAAVAVFFLFVPLEAGSLVYILPLVACMGGLATIGLIFLFSYQRNQGFQPVKIVLSGVGFAAALSGLMVVLMSGTDSRKVDFIAKWLAGNIWGTDWPFIWALLPWILILFPFIWYKSRRLDLLGLSEPTAIGIGVSVSRERAGLLIAAVALAAAAVSVTGGIAFVGLVAPHIAKSIVGPRARSYLPVSILFGAWMLLVADTIGRSVAAPDGIPAGTVVALIGAPYFVYLLMKK